MLRSLLPAALAAALLAPAAAGAAERVGTGYGDPANDSNNDIQLVGDRVLLDASARFARAPRFVAVDLASGRRTTVLAPRPAAGRAIHGRFAAVPGRIAFSLSDTADRVADAPSLRITAGAPGGPFAPVDGCEGSTVRNDPDSLAVSAQAVAYGGNGCVREGITVHSFDGAPARHFAGADFLGAALAGRYVAFRHGWPSATGIEVADRVTGETLYALPERAARADALDRWHLAEDGTLVVVDDGRLQDNRYCGRRITWYSPAEPFEHVLPHTACGSDSALSGGRLAFVRWAGGRRAELVSTDLAGGGMQVLARFDEADQELSLDAEGDRVVWHEHGCAGDSLWSARLGDAPRHARWSPCTMRIPGHTLRVGAGGVARLRVRCPQGCAAVQLLIAFPDGSRAQLRGLPSVKGRATLDVPLPRAVALRVRDGKEVTGTAEVRWDPVHGEAGDAFTATLVRG